MCKGFIKSDPKELGKVTIRLLELEKITIEELSKRIEKPIEVIQEWIRLAKEEKDDN